jgi:MFS family permease
MKLNGLHYGWILALVGACILVTNALLVFTFGVFINPLTLEFGWERGALSGAFSMAVLIVGGLGLLAGGLSDKYGARIVVTFGGIFLGIGFLLMSQISSLWHVYIILGLVVGIGGSFTFVPVLSTVPRWFDKRVGTATGITMAGFGFGGIISPFLAQWLIASYGWRQSFIMLGVITFILVIPLAQLIKYSPRRVGLKPYGEGGTTEEGQKVDFVTEELSLTQAIKTSRFWIFCLLLFCFFYCEESIIVHIIPHAGDIGISAIIAASILSFVAGISIIGRLGIGFVSDKVGSRLSLTACLSLITFALIWLLFIREIWMFYVFAVVFGLAYGGFVSLLTVVAAELFGRKFLGSMLGGLFFMGLIGGAIGAPLSGTIFDITGDYRLAFLICTVLCTVAVILSIVILKYKSSTGSTNE